MLSTTKTQVFMDFQIPVLHLYVYYVYMCSNCMQKKYSSITATYKPAKVQVCP